MADIKPTIKRKRKSKRTLLFIILGVVLLLIIIAVVASGKKEKIVQVQTEKVSKRNITQVVSGTGTVQPETKVDISAEISGEIVNLPVTEGQMVEKGQLLVKIKADAYTQQLSQQRASINFSESQVEVSQNNLKKAELEYERQKQLHEKGLVSQSDLDNARINYQVAQSQVKSANANVRQNVAIYRQSGVTLSKTTINAPMSGTISALNSELGEKVLGTQTMTGTTIMTISDLTVMNAEIEISETDITNVKIGDKADITVDAFPDKIIQGEVFEIANSAKTKGVGTQEQVVNFIVKIRVTDTSVLLKPGMSCNADIKVNSKNDVISVPIQCITARDEFNMNKEQGGDDQQINRVSEEKQNKKEKPKEIVFVLDEATNKVKIVQVKTGITDDKYIEIKEGLKPDEVVVKGPYKSISKELEEGTKVKVDNEIKKKKEENE